MRLIKRAYRVVIAFLVLTLGLAAPASAQSIDFDSGHVDAFHVTASPGELFLDLKEDVTGSGVRHAPEETTLIVTENAWSDATTSVPEIGQATYYLPQTQDPDIVWPGWDTQAVVKGGFSAIDFVFEEVEGPGEVFIFETGGLGGINSVLADGGVELTSGAVISQPNPAHRHVNWAFTESGNYSMTLYASGVDGSNTEVDSNSATYRWIVGDGGGSVDDGDRTASPDRRSATPRDTTQRSNNSASDSAQSGSASAKGSSDKKDSSTATGKRDGKACVAGITPMIKDDRNVPAVWTSPADLSFHLGDAARTTLPESVGPVPAGTAWMIGATQQDNVPWLGANTQHPSMLDNQIGDVTWELVSFEGPGPVVVYTQGGLGQIMGEEWFRGADGRAQGSHDIAPNTHVHPVWMFGAPGTYKLGIRQSTTHNGAVFSGTDVLTFHVGEDGGNAREGHFDLGGVFNPDGGDCDTAGSNSASAKGGSGAQGTGGASGAGGKLAETGSNVMTLPFTVLGLGLVVFGIGVAYFTAALRKVTR